MSLLFLWTEIYSSTYRRAKAKRESESSTRCWAYVSATIVPSGVGKVASLGGGSSLMLNPTASVLRFSGLASPRLSYYSCITKHELRQGTCQKRFPDAGWTQKDK